MENTIPNHNEAADLLVQGSKLEAAVGAADTGRRKIYLIWAAVLPLAMVWFDVLSPGAGALAMVPFVLIGVVGTLLVVRTQQVTDMAAMGSYFAVMGLFSVMWIFLVSVVGPALGDRYAFGWTVTGLLGSIPFLIGYVWDRRR